MKPWEKYSSGQPDGPWSKYGSQAVSEPAEANSMTWGEAGMQAVGNIPQSAADFAGNIYQAVRHPVDTGKNLYSAFRGAVRQIPGAMPYSDPKKIESEQRDIKTAQAVGGMFADRYGGTENIKRTLATDPVGLLADASTVLTGGGSLAAKAPGIVGKGGRAIQAVGRAVDPMTIAGKAIKPVLKSAGKAGSAVVGGFGTHTGAEPIREAARAGYAGGQRADDFTAAMRGVSNAEDVVTDAKTALGKVRQSRSAAYKTGMAGVKADPTVLDFKPIDQAFRDTLDVGSFKGKSISRSTSGVTKQIGDILDEWRSADPKQFHTPEGMDALKRAIGDIRDSTDFGTPSRVVADKVYNAVKTQVAKQAPSYAKTMKGYEEASNLIKEIERSLSLGEKASADTALRKLQSIMRNNVNTNYGKRLDLVDELERVGGASLRPQLAGQALNTWTPRGLGNVVAGGTGIAAAATANPTLLALMAAQSPRLVGEIVYGGGKVAGKTARVNKKIADLLSSIGMSERGVAQGAFQAGRVDEETKKALADALLAK